MKNIRSRILLLVCICAATGAGTGARAELVQVGKIALMPLARGTVAVDSPKLLPDLREPELITRDQPIDAGAEAVVTECLQKALQKTFSGKIVPLNETAGAEELLAYMKKTEAIKAHARKLGEKLQATHVLTGTVFRYRQRKGTAYGADKPASIGFSLYLIDVTSGDFVWSGVFDKTQQSLSENLLNAPEFFKGGAKWVTAEEFSCLAAEEMSGKLKGAVSGKKLK